MREGKGMLGSMENLFGSVGNDQPFGSYEEYMEFLFASVNEGLNRYLANLKQVYATGEGGYKNVLYPDLEIAHDVCIEKIERFLDSQEKVSWAEEAGGEIQGTVGNDWRQEEKASEGDDDFLDLDALFSDFAMESSQALRENIGDSPKELSVEEMVDYIGARAELALENGRLHPAFPRGFTENQPGA